MTQTTTATIRIITLCSFLVSFIFALQAIPAFPHPIKIVQPDGTSLTIQLHGDEFSHYTTTEDGYTIVPNEKNIYVYAIQDITGNLTQSSIRVNEVENRTATEKSLIVSLPKGIQSKATVKEGISRISKVSSSDPSKVFPLNGSPKSLVILVNFADKSFSIPTPQTAFSNLLNQPNYSENGATGSARDWFIAGSNGVFTPNFVVVGPYTLPQATSYYGNNTSSSGGSDSNPRQMVIDACTAAFKDGVNFADYDTDNDGYVDNVFIYYAGYNEAEGAATTTVWPHRWKLADTSTTFDGKIVYDYACTSELKGISGSTMCGIGTFCHEFSHTLGLPDFYDTSGSSTYHYALDRYSVMDYGPYLNNGRTPPAYSCYEKFCLGFITPEELSTPTTITLQDIKNSNKAYILSETTHNLSSTNPSPSEFYMLENRQQTGWDAYLPGHGLFIWHINYSPTAWKNNVLNNQDPLRVDLCEADGTANTTSQSGDPFPGTNNVTSYIPRLWKIGDSSIPGGTDINRPLTNISENSGVVTFKIMGGTPTFSSFSALPATNVTPSSFTANWSASTGAEKYLLSVYSQIIAAPTTVKQEFTTTPSSWYLTSTTNDTNSGEYGAASPSIKLNSSGSSIVTENYPGAIRGISFWIKGLSTNTGSYITIQGSTNQITWNNIATLSSISTTGNTLTYEVDSTQNYRSLMFTYFKSAGTVCLDDIAVTYSNCSKTYVLQDATVTGASTTSSNITSGLTTNGTYYYIVKAANSSETSVQSNEIKVVLGNSTGINDMKLEGYQAYYSNNVLTVFTPKNAKLQIFNTVGQPVLQQSLAIGTNQIPLIGKGLYIIKIDGYTTKIIMP